MIQILWAFIGSLGFSLLCNLKGRRLWTAAIGAAITWGLYMHFDAVGFDPMISCGLCGIFVGIYAEIMAIYNKAPTTLFLISVGIPLVPGSGLYYTMQNIVVGNTEMAAYYGVATTKMALGIVIGFMIVAVLAKYIRQLLDFLKTKEQINDKE